MGGNGCNSGLSRLLTLVAFVCGGIGLAAGLTGNSWKLHPVGWFTGGSLVALIAIAVALQGGSKGEGGTS